MKKKNRVLSLSVAACVVLFLSLPIHATPRRDFDRWTPPSIVKVIKKLLGIKTLGDSPIPPIPCQSGC